LTKIQLDRQSAYRYWTTSIGNSSAIINGPYLVRNASFNDGTLSIHADFDQTSEIEILGLPTLKVVRVNGVDMSFYDNGVGVSLSFKYETPQFNIPNLNNLNWSSIDSLPEINSDFNDSRWPSATFSSSNNSYQHLWTPTSLFASDYGFTAGVLVFRGHFIAKGTEELFKVRVWLEFGNTLCLRSNTVSFLPLL
jgi:hypothetical protein